MKSNFFLISLLAVLACVSTTQVQAAPGDVDPTFRGQVTNYPGPYIGGCYVGAIAVQPDGKILCGGNFTVADGWSRYGVARLNSDGTLDMTFDAGSLLNPPGNASVSSIAVQPDGRILVGGTFTYIGSRYQFAFARLNTNGTLDTSFSFGQQIGSSSSVYAIAAQTNGQIIIGGLLNNWQPIARVGSNGLLDTNWIAGLHLGGIVRDIALQNDGKILMAGQFSPSTSIPAVTNIGRLNADGTIDTTFTHRISFSCCCGIEKMALQPDGKILIGAGCTGTYTGSFAVDGTNYGGLMRLNSDGSVDNTFHAVRDAYNAPPAAKALALQSDGRILVAGNGLVLTRFNSDGSADPSFNLISLTNGSYPASVITVQADNKILIGGFEGGAGSIATNGIARIFADNPPQFNFITASNGHLHLEGRAATNAHLRLAACTNFPQWLPIADFFNTNGLFSFDDPQSASAPQRFYRAEWLP